MSDLINKAVELLKAEGYTVQEPQKLTKEDILKIKDPAKRKKAIAENLDLFIRK